MHIKGSFHTTSNAHTKDESGRFSLARPSQKLDYSRIRQAMAKVAANPYLINELADLFPITKPARLIKCFTISNPSLDTDEFKALAILKMIF